MFTIVTLKHLGFYNYVNREQHYSVLFLSLYFDYSFVDYRKGSSISCTRVLKLFV